MKVFAIFSLFPLLCYGHLQNVTIDLSTDAVKEIESCEANAEVSTDALFLTHEIGHMELRISKINRFCFKVQCTNCQN